MRNSKLTQQIEESTKLKSKEIEEVTLFNTGSTELNLACSDTVKGAFPPGVMVNIVGDSHAGKTYLAHSILAEATLNPSFKDYRLIYDNSEAADTGGIARMFGKTLVERIEAPDGDRSDGIHDFKVNIWKVLRGEKPFIYVLDSLDALTTSEANKQLDDAVDGKKEKGSYGMEKPKVLSGILGPVCRKLQNTKSLLIILSQTRDDINPMSFQEKTRSGGRALKFYASYEMWLALIGTHRKKTGEFDRIVGSKTRVKVTKNKLTGKVREAEFSIYYDYGIDDIGEMIDFMVDGKYWSKPSEKTIKAVDLDLECSREKLIKQVEENNLEGKLREIVGQKWNEIEQAVQLGRKKKYE